MKAEKLQEVLRLHKMWLDDDEEGVKANLEGADLINASLRGANLKDANLKDANLRYADLRYADLEWANLKGADLTGADLDYSALSIWCGSQFKADERICKQLVAHTLRIMELSNEGSGELINLMREYKSGWHREKEFQKNMEQK